MTFCGCDYLTQVQLPDCLEDIDGSCFERTGIAEITIPACVRRIGERAFYGCARLARVQFARDSQLQDVEWHAFDGTPASQGRLRYPAGTKVESVPLRPQNFIQLFAN